MREVSSKVFSRSKLCGGAIQMDVYDLRHFVSDFERKRRGEMERSFYKQ